MCTSTARSWWGIRSESTIPAGSSQGTSSCPRHAPRAWKGALRTDRKSTRLNSSHVKISYAVFCLKKKTYTVLLQYLVEQRRVVTQLDKLVSALGGQICPFEHFHPEFAAHSDS